MIRTGLDKQMTNPGRANRFRASRLIPAVEYLQAQRARAMMMAKLAEATAQVDVYLVPANSGGWGRRTRRAWSRRRRERGCGCGTAFQDGEYRRLSRDQRSAWVSGFGLADSADVLWAAV